MENSIRRVEEQNHQDRRTRIKIVEEKPGKTVKESLSQISNWENVVCMEDDCFLCRFNPTNRKFCRKPGMGYVIKCTLCAEDDIVAQYEGETGRCLYTWGLEHIEQGPTYVRR